MLSRFIVTVELISIIIGFTFTSKDLKTGSFF